MKERLIKSSLLEFFCDFDDVLLLMKKIYHLVLQRLGIGRRRCGFWGRDKKQAIRYRWDSILVE